MLSVVVTHHAAVYSLLKANEPGAAELAAALDPGAASNSDTPLQADAGCCFMSAHMCIASDHNVCVVVCHAGSVNMTADEACGQLVLHVLIQLFV
jgi:hypothetical protein